MRRERSKSSPSQGKDTGCDRVEREVVQLGHGGVDLDDGEPLHGGVDRVPGIRIAEYCRILHNIAYIAEMSPHMRDGCRASIKKRRRERRE